MTSNQVKLVGLFIATFLLSGCRQTSNEDLIGDWIVDKITNSGKEVLEHTNSIKFYMLPFGYSGKQTVRFEKPNTLSFPGLRTEDLLCKWNISNDELIIETDTAAIESQL